MTWEIRERLGGLGGVVLRSILTHVSRLAVRRLAGGGIVLRPMLRLIGTAQNRAERLQTRGSNVMIRRHLRMSIALSLVAGLFALGVTPASARGGG
jgi:hypothetical protein